MCKQFGRHSINLSVAKIQCTMNNLLLLIGIVAMFPALIFSQSDSSLEVIKTTSTGSTSGHLANITVKNHSDQALEIKGETFFWPSEKYQNRVAWLPNFILPAGQIAEVPAYGFCTDPHNMPTPPGLEDPISNGIPVNDPIELGPIAFPDPLSPNFSVSESIISNPLLPEFSITDTMVIKSYRGFKSTRKKSGPRVTWPGSNSPVRGTISPNAFPEGYAPILVNYVKRIVAAAEALRSSHDIEIPFLGNLQKQWESIIQQTIWYVMSVLTGIPYDKEDLRKKIYEEIAKSSGTVVGTLPKAVKEQVDHGVDLLWATMMETAVIAEVINRDKQTTFVHPQSDVRCGCTSCRVEEPLRLYNAKTGEEIRGDSIPWYIDEITTQAPVVVSDCPDGCKSVNIAYTLEDVYYFQNKRRHTWTSLPKEIKVQGPGEIRFTMKYYCNCEGERCGEGRIEKTLYLTESNDCCDRIRSENKGELRFKFNDGSARILRNQIMLELNSGKREVLDFDFNLEAIFCNLSDNQVYASLQTLAAQQTGNSNVTEYLNSQDISLDHPTDIVDTPPWYNLLFSKNINGQEMSIGITIDEASCKYALQILYHGRLYEFKQF